MLEIGEDFKMARQLSLFKRLKDSRIPDEPQRDSRLSYALEQLEGSIMDLTDQEIVRLALQNGVPEVKLDQYAAAKRFLRGSKTEDVEEKRQALIHRMNGDRKVPIGDGRYCLISELDEDIVERAYQNHRRADPQIVNHFERTYQL
jgi:hypothetical protein